MNVINYLKALSDNTRLRIFNLLLNRELNVNEIVKIMGMGQSRISRHLKILSDSGLVIARRDGLWVYYSLLRDDSINRFLDSIYDLIKNGEIFQADLQRSEAVLIERTKRMRKFFDSIAGDWDSLKKDILGDLNLSTIVAEQITPCNVSADLGCGTGDLLITLKKSSELVIGVDNSPKMLELARKRFAGDDNNVELRLGELEHLPLRDCEADFAVINMVLHHLSMPDAGIMDAYRILRHEKQLIIIDFDKHTIENMRDEYGDRWLGFEVSEITNWLTKAGFVDIKTKQFNLSGHLRVNLFIAVK